MWLKKYWPALVGLALQAESLWKFLKWALDWRGRYDALAGTYHEVGGMGAVIGYILDPPPWFYPVAFVAGVILIWWNFRRNREQAYAEISPPRGRVAPGVTTPRGAKLITLGQYLIFGAAGVMVIGLSLMIIGRLQNDAQIGELVDGVVAASKKLEALLPDKPEATAKQGRVFVPPELTPERLFSFYRENTAIQADELTKHFVGQWIKVTGTLNDVSRTDDFLSQVTFERSNTPILEWTWLDFTTIYMYFREPAQIDRLKIMRRGDKITVIGQIQLVQNVTLHLDNCELAD